DIAVIAILAQLTGGFQALAAITTIIAGSFTILSTALSFIAGGFTSSTTAAAAFGIALCPLTATITLIAAPIGASIATIVLLKSQRATITSPETQASFGGGMAGGGIVGGRGTGTSDSNLAWLSRGEHVMPARAVQQPGVLAFLEALRFSGGNLSRVLD